MSCNSLTPETMQAITVCSTIVCVICSIIWGVVWYNLAKPSDNEIMMMLVEKYNFHPAVVECLSRGWNKIHDFQICQEVLTKAHIDPVEADMLHEQLIDGDYVDHNE